MDRFIDTQDFRNVMNRMAKALQPWPWCLIGGRAVEVWTNPPQTPDVDVLVNLHPKDIRDLENAVIKAGFDLLTRFHDVGMSPMWFFKDIRTGTEADIIAAYEDVHFWAIERSQILSFFDGKLRIPVARAEDVIILKANAACAPGRAEKVSHDIEAIKAIAGSHNQDLDWEYIRTVLDMAGADWSDERTLLRRLHVI